MDETTLADGDEALERTVSVVVAYVANNSVPVAGLPDLIALVHAALANLGQPKAEPQRDALQPPVSIKKSITPGYLISMEDGRRYKTLKRHLSGRGLTPDQYRQKWNLPVDYPMVAPDYAVRRSELAKAAGLGRKAATDDGATPTTEPKRRGRPPKVA